ncbi:MAG: DUF4349 domain-containing protein [Anaerolineales bacterium]|nr:DUF4349 domain-containing protein [Anaerolineales bacterium]
MKTKFNLLVLFVLVGVMILSACGNGGAGMSAPATEAPAATEAAFFMEEPAPAQSAGDGDVAKEESAPPSDLAAGPVYDTGASPDNAAYAATHMIIKNADVKLLVEDTDIAIDRATQAIGDMNGYIISSRVWYQPWYDGQNYKYATITIGIPVDQFERILNRLRTLSVKVLDETASGEDVTNQFVDLQSQVTNLEATRDRIKSFLEEAKTVDEALRINAELANVEAQIEQIKGQMNYLEDRSAFSTITVNFEPVLPELLTPTPTPEPTPAPWDPGNTIKNTKKTVINAYQNIIELSIRVLGMLIILAPFVLIVWAVLKFFTRKPKKPIQ